MILPSRATLPPRDGESEIEKAREEVERARRILEQMEAELQRKMREARAAEKQAGKFEYVPVPKEGFTVEEFEKTIAAARN